MKTQKREIIVKPYAEFSRGTIEQSETNASFFTLRMSGGDYDFSNWTVNDLEDLRAAINWMLKNKRNEI